MAFLAGNGEVTTANDAGDFERMACALDFLRVAGVELQGALLSVGLDKLHADDRGACVENELLDEGGLVHGDEGGGLSPCVINNGTTKRLCEASNYQRCLWYDCTRGMREPAVAFGMERHALAEGCEVVLLLHWHRGQGQQACKREQRQHDALHG